MFLKENPDLSDEIERLIFEKLGIGEFADKAGEENQDLAVPGVGDDLSDDPVDMVPNVDFDDEDDE